ncbi:hypothetical protein PRIPAC_79907 [Pristionchus pacificus]|nr:hypothetical protein PRIPAC_79907 [Pristionchus pacificus]
MPTLLHLLLPLAAVIAQTAAQCGGHDHPACARFMSNGFCTNTTRPLEFRQRICGRGCGLCLADCHDTSPMCAAYSRTGFCENGRFAVETKRSMCMKTCFCDKRTTTTMPTPLGNVDESLVKITDNELGPAIPQPVPVVGPGPSGPQPVPIVNPGKVPLIPNPGPQPVPLIGTGSGKDSSGLQPVPVPIVPGPEEGPLPVVVIEGGNPGPVFPGPGGPVPVPDLTGSDPNPVPVRPKTRVLGGGSTATPDKDMLQPEGVIAATEQPRRPFTSCGLLKDDSNNEVLVVHEGVSLDLARHPFNDRATSVLLLPDCEMDLWQHVGQAGHLLRFHSASEHTFKLDGPYRRAISSLACRCN